jgi:hypothetical protein
VRVRTEAQRRIYQLDPRGLGAVKTWLSSVQRVWSGQQAAAASPPATVAARVPPRRLGMRAAEKRDRDDGR